MEEEDGELAGTPSLLKYRIAVEQVQINMQADNAGGRFLLAADKGTITERHYPSLLQTVATLNLTQVQNLGLVLLLLVCTAVECWLWSAGEDLVHLMCLKFDVM